MIHLHVFTCFYMSQLFGLSDFETEYQELAHHVVIAYIFCVL